MIKQVKHISIMVVFFGLALSMSYCSNSKNTGGKDTVETDSNKEERSFQFENATWRMLYPGQRDAPKILLVEFSFTDTTQFLEILPDSLYFKGYGGNLRFRKDGSNAVLRSQLQQLPENLVASPVQVEEDQAYLTFKGKDLQKYEHIVPKVQELEAIFMP